jgi:nucleotide-binding universal stress UspA family protein
VSARTIVLGVDGSAGSFAAVDWCAEHAPLLDARVVAAYVLAPLVFMVPPTLAAKPDFDESAMRARLRAQLEAWCTPLRDTGVPCELLLMDGIVADTLMKLASDVDADLVVVGRRGGGGFSELVLGSVPHALSHHCRIPVVIVPVDP